jgi:hypothetical protein
VIQLGSHIDGQISNKFVDPRSIGLKAAVVNRLVVHDSIAEPPHVLEVPVQLIARTSVARPKGAIEGLAPQCLVVGAAQERHPETERQRRHDIVGAAGPADGLANAPHGLVNESGTQSCQRRYRPPVRPTVSLRQLDFRIHACLDMRRTFRSLQAGSTPCYVAQ